MYTISGDRELRRPLLAPKGHSGECMGRSIYHQSGGIANSGTRSSPPDDTWMVGVWGIQSIW